MATRKRKPLRIADRWLWQVKLHKYNFHLWVTTRYNSITEATENTTKLIDRKYRGAKVISIESHGTLDA